MQATSVVGRPDEGGRPLCSRAFPPPLEPRLRAALAVAHAQAPFSPIDVRGAAHRAAAVVARFGFDPTLFRGGLDVGGAELDHVWVVAGDRVVDAAFPLFSPNFVACLRAYVAGDVDDDELDGAAHAYSLRWRVLGAFPASCRYLGAPVWSAARRHISRRVSKEVAGS